MCVEVVIINIYLHASTLPLFVIDNCHHVSSSSFVVVMFRIRGMGRMKEGEEESMGCEMWCWEKLKVVIDVGCW